MSGGVRKGEYATLSLFRNGVDGFNEAPELSF